LNGVAHFADEQFRRPSSWSMLLCSAGHIKKHYADPCCSHVFSFIYLLSFLKLIFVLFFRNRIS
jgi:hypothetical protein